MRRARGRNRRGAEGESLWTARDAAVVNNTFVGIGERGVLLVRPGNEVDSPPAGCGRSVRLTRTEGLALSNNVFVLSGVVDETLLYQTTGVGVKVTGFEHRGNTFFNGGRDVPGGGLAVAGQGGARRFGKVGGAAEVRAEFR